VDATDSLVVAGVSVDVSNAGTIPTLNVGQTVVITGSYSNDVLLADQVSIKEASSAEYAHHSDSQDSHGDGH